MFVCRCPITLGSSKVEYHGSGIFTSNTKAVELNLSTVYLRKYRYRILYQLSNSKTKLGHNKYMLQTSEKNLDFEWLPLIDVEN